MKDMDIRMLVRLNELWQPIYPYLAQWIGQWYPTKTGLILELGPFSGGISEALMNRFKNVKAVCLTPQAKVAQSMREQFQPNLETMVGSLEAPPFNDLFRLVICRGAFFFLTPDIIKGTYGVLESGAYALLGGGYGPLTPSEEIAKIADESKTLNERLGKKWLSRGGLEDMVRDAGMEGCSQILEEGGLWLLLKKEPV